MPAIVIADIAVSRPTRRSKLGFSMLWCSTRTIILAFDESDEVAHTTCVNATISRSKPRRVSGLLEQLNDPVIAAKVKQRHSTYKTQPQRKYLTRIAKYSAMKLLGTRPVYSLAIRALHITRKRLDELVNGSVRNLSPTQTDGDSLMVSIRFRPCQSLLSVINRRLRSSCSNYLAARRDRGELIHRLLSNERSSQDARVELIGRHPKASHSHWVVPICVTAERRELLDALFDAGFDATAGCQLVVAMRPSLEATASKLGNSHSSELPKLQRIMRNQIVFLPNYPEMPEREIHRMVSTIQSHFGQATPQNQGLTRCLENAST